MAGGGRIKERWRALTLEQRLSVGVLGIAGFVAFLFGVIQVRAGIIRPFTTDVQTLVELKKQFGPTAEERAEEQKKTDTDGDGISDYDELNRYRTSPYVRDSDSDGEPDNIEVAKGTDPNCAKGTVCVVGSGATAATSSGSGFVAPPVGGSGSASFPGLGTSAVPPRDVSAIRAYLRASGMSEQELSAYSDEELLRAYDESLPVEQDSPDSDEP